MRANIFLFLAAYCLIRSTECRRPFAFHIESIQCLGNPIFVKSFECSVLEANSAATISMDVTFARDIKKFTFDLLVMLPKPHQNLILFNTNQMDGCAFLENSSPFPLVQIIRKQFAKYSNIPNKCPMCKETPIQVRGLKLDPDSFPTYVPETKFNVVVSLYENGENIFNLTTNGTCENTRKFFKRQ